MALPAYVVQRAFTPLSVPGLAAWYDAADSASVITEGSPLRVSQWSDKSGNGHHATNTTSDSTQPSYTTAGRNGLNVLSFAAASVQRLSVPSSTATFKFLHDGTPCWWIAVSTYGASSNPNAFLVLFATHSGASAQVGMYYAFEDRTGVGNNSINAAVLRGVGGSYVVATDNGSTIKTEYQNIITPQTVTVQEALMDVGNATAANRFALRINGGPSLAANQFSAAASTANSTGDLTLGATSGNTSPLQGDLCELMFFSQQPTAAARDLIRRYLGAKWGVTVR